MKIFVIHSQRDGQAIQKAIGLLKSNHQILNEIPVAHRNQDSQAIFSKQITNADALIVVVSDNFYQDGNIQSELSSIFLHEIFLAGDLRIAVANLDQSPIPSLLLGRPYFELSEKNYDKGVSRLSHWLQDDKQDGKKASRLSHWLQALPDSIANRLLTAYLTASLGRSI